MNLVSYFTKNLKYNNQSCKCSNYKPFINTQCTIYRIQAFSLHNRSTEENGWSKLKIKSDLRQCICCVVQIYIYLVTFICKLYNQCLIQIH